MNPQIRAAKIKVKPARYGCHSDDAKNRCQHEFVEHSSKTVFWPYVFTRTCQYDKYLTDSKCAGCQQKRVSNG
jgi:hypothetical protein